MRKGLKKESNQITIQEVESILSFAQPRLIFTNMPQYIHGEGSYIVSDGPNPNGPVATFEIELKFFKNYPNDEPAIYETGRKLKRIAKRHMYQNGRCCTCVWEEWLAVAKDTSLRGFCTGPLHNFFLSQVRYDQTGEWPFGQRSHGPAGVLEAACVLLGLEENDERAESYLRAIAAKSVKGHWDCPCGSGSRVRDCHFREIQKLHTDASQSLAGQLLDRLRKAKREEM